MHREAEKWACPELVLKVGCHSPKRRRGCGHRGERSKASAAQTPGRVRGVWGAREDWPSGKQAERLEAGGSTLVGISSCKFSSWQKKGCLHCRRPRRGVMGALGREGGMDLREALVTAHVWGDEAGGGEGTGTAMRRRQEKTRRGGEERKSREG